MENSRRKERLVREQRLHSRFLSPARLPKKACDMRILIADDHAMFRRGLRETLAEAFSRVIFGEAKTAAETLELVRRHPWDVVILDISMPGKSGLDILDDVKRIRPRTPVLLLTMHPEQQYARRALDRKSVV